MPDSSVFSLGSAEGWVLTSVPAEGEAVGWSLLPVASSIRISDNTVMTTSRDVLETLGTDKQPSDVLVALGYASWEKGQLEQEILDNAWLTAPADLNILFKTPIADRWREAAKLIGVDILTMPGVAGHA